MLFLYAIAFLIIFFLMVFFVSSGEFEVGLFFSGMVVVLVGMITIIGAGISPNTETVIIFESRAAELTIMREGVTNADELFFVNNLILEYNKDLKYQQRLNPEGFWDIFINNDIYLIETLSIDNTIAD